jgi:hypothetical protein
LWGARLEPIAVFFSSGDVGEHQHSAHRRRRIDIGVEESFLGCRA